MNYNRILQQLVKLAAEENNKTENKNNENDNKNNENENKEQKIELKGDYYHNARQMVEKNKRLFQEGKIDKCRYFEFKNYKILNPFKDEKGEKEVDPREYYGKAYEESAFNRVN